LKDLWPRTRSGLKCTRPSTMEAATFSVYHELPPWLDDLKAGLTAFIQCVASESRIIAWCFWWLSLGKRKRNNSKIQVSFFNRCCLLKKILCTSSKSLFKRCLTKIVIWGCITFCECSVYEWLRVVVNCVCKIKLWRMLFVSFPSTDWFVLYLQKMNKLLTFSLTVMSYQH